MRSCRRCEAHRWGGMRHESLGSRKKTATAHQELLTRKITPPSNAMNVGGARGARTAGHFLIVCARYQVASPIVAHWARGGARLHLPPAPTPEAPWPSAAGSRPSRPLPPSKTAKHQTPNTTSTWKKRKSSMDEQETLDFQSPLTFLTYSLSHRNRLWAGRLWTDGPELTRDPTSTDVPPESVTGYKSPTYPTRASRLETWTLH
ncbi:hypothetical protein B0T19DRAFT_148709 [Cercophora scortea]|uniref:Uncharacterized protein n=1 Tax=Cercophora scortea TaxID=314031 RepID=A0AAE0IZR1_9PEZI|nr:hypothetical protein B0T19DRAFT_148709 [Cercophora scortea]